MSTDHASGSDAALGSLKGDMEKGIPEPSVQDADVAHGITTEVYGPVSLWKKLANYGVEIRGIEPVPEIERTDTRFLNVGTWLGASVLCLLP
jgi:hypothetical protein